MDSRAAGPTTSTGASTATRTGSRARSVDEMILRSSLYRSARLLGDAQVLASGNRKRITRRAKNKFLGRALGRSGFWRFLWR
jgi:hypothetical protein